MSGRDALVLVERDFAMLTSRRLALSMTLIVAVTGTISASNAGGLRGRGALLRGSA